MQPAVVSLAGELDASDASWADGIGKAIESGHREIVVDLLNVSFVDSSVVRELVLAHRRTEAEGWVRVVYTHHLIRRVIDICGLSDLLPQYTTVDAAVRGAPTRQHPLDGPAPGAANNGRSPS